MKFNIYKFWHCIYILLLISSLEILSAEKCHADKNNSTFTQSESLFDTLESSTEAMFAERSNNLENEWARLEAEEEQKWLKLEAEVLQKWDVYHPTTEKIWVNYSPQKESYGQVDFEKGEVTLETLVPVGDRPEEVEENLQKQLKTISEQVDSTNTPVLKDLLPPNTEKAVEEKKIEISQTGKVAGKDGIVRQKYQVKITMVPDHLQKRVERYFPSISVASREQKIDPALVLAVIHSESAFNPFARSSIPAFGLMQIVPKYAGKDAYMELFGEERLLSPDYLYNADNNILLGVTYLKMLNFKYFQDVSDLEKRRFIIVCAYNWGPTAMRNRFVKKTNVSSVSREDLFELLLKKVPKETHDYLIRVETRRKMYQKTIDSIEAK